MSRYVVTGCAGFIGSHLTDWLLDARHEVVGIDAFTSYYEPAQKRANLANAQESNHFELHELDLSTDAFDELFTGAEVVFHLAAQPGVRPSWGKEFDTYVQHNVIATKRLFDAALGLGTRVVFASSSSVYGDAEVYPTPEDITPRPISPYGITKLTCEHLAYTLGVRGLDAVGLRYFTVYGPRQRPDMAFARIVSCLATDAPFEVLGNGGQSRDFTYVDDAVTATLAVAEHGNSGSIYNVGGGSAASLLDAIEIFESLAGEQLRVKFVDSAAGDARRTSADTRRIRSDVGWRPTTSLPTGIARQLEYSFADNGGPSQTVAVASARD
jgi:UDP-glucuronate 4-epimerase